MSSMYILTTDDPYDRPTTDLASSKISNGQISATGHPIHFMFGSMVRFSGAADRMALRTAATFKNFERPYLCNG